MRYLLCCHRRSLLASLELVPDRTVENRPGGSDFRLLPVDVTELTLVSDSFVNCKFQNKASQELTRPPTTTST